MRQPPSAPTPAAGPACDCDADPIGCLKQMFVDLVQRGRIERGQSPARRPVFLRLHGVAHGRFEVVPDLSAGLAVGLFTPGVSYPAWVRFSSDLPDGRPDLKSTVGVGIKLFGVPGRTVLAPDAGARTADFVLQNMDVFFVDDAREMCAFTKASLTSPAAAAAWLKDHPRTAEVLDAMEKVVPTVLGAEVWSVIPFRFGADRWCKYKLEPEVVPEGPEPDYDDPDYLRADLAARLARGEARFRFAVQLRTDPDAMPLD
ncbi:MAG TPA: catalase, partial [Methylomirabilota bacterium]|nr:catalase [Methylomirabilota bacterium]